MNIKEFQIYGTKILKDSNIEAPALEAGVMLCSALNCNRTYLYTHDDRELKEQEVAALQDMLIRRANGMPLQYIIGETEFMSLSFVVSPAVLIPRQDTEILVEKCIQLVQKISRSAAVAFPESNKESATDDFIAEQGRTSDINSSAGTSAVQTGVRVLDMCTGSGCIAVSIAHFCQNCRVVACDVSQEALKVAKTNTQRAGVQNRLELRQGDLFEALGNEELFDIIVSNPPYIETNVIETLQKEVKEHEPFIALDGGTDGLDFYRKIINQAPGHLKNGGFLVFEIGYDQGQNVVKLMSDYFEEISILKDLGGNDRVVFGRWR